MVGSAPRSRGSWASYRLQLVCPPEAATTAQTQLRASLRATGLEEWFMVAAPVPGLWALWWDDQQIWHGVTVDPGAWETAILEGRWARGLAVVNRPAAHVLIRGGAAGR